MKVDYDLYYKDSGSGNKGHYVESNVCLLQNFVMPVDDTFLIRLKLFDRFFIEVPFLHI